MEKETFKNKMTDISNAFNRDLPKQETLKIYWEHLKDIKDNDYIEICNEIIKTERFFPSISVFLEKFKDCPSQEWRKAL